MPVVGPLIRKMALARFTRTFGTLVSAGVPILSALDIVGDTAGNEVVARAVKKIRAAIKEGETIAKPLSESPVFPSMLVQMIAVGEETGALDAMLNKIADFYDDEVVHGGRRADVGDRAADDGVRSAGVVGGMVIALYMPMFQRHRSGQVGARARTVTADTPAIGDVRGRNAKVPGRSTR